MRLLLTLLPYLLQAAVFGVGASLIASRLRGQARTLGLAGCLLLLVLSVFGGVYAVSLPALYENLGGSRWVLLNVISIGRTLLDVVGIGLLVAAVLAPREAPYGTPNAFTTDAHGRPTPYDGPDARATDVPGRYSS